jgi:hypothetical protein
MKLEVERFKNQRIETDELIRDLIEVSKAIRKNPTIAEYNEHGKYEASVYMRRFGSWNNSLCEAGLLPNNKQWTEQELLDNLLSVWLLLYKQPTRRDMDNKKISKISSGSYLRYFNTWNNALQACVRYSNNTDDRNELVVSTNSDSLVHKTARDVNLRMRFNVMKRDGFKCCCCGRSPSTTPNLELHVDHVIPWSKGGESVIDNLQTLCMECNLGKSNLV